MLNKKVEQSINQQINAELFSSYLYMSMASYLEFNSLKGFAHWMQIQAQEELTHAAKMATYIGERSGRVILTAIKAPTTDWNDIIAVFQDTVVHEEHVTDLINKIVTLASKENDHATVNFLQWFVNEQVEEVSTANDMLDQLKLVKGEGSGLFILDREAAQRVFTPPPAA